MYVCIVVNPTEAFDSVRSPINRSQLDSLRSPSTAVKVKPGAKDDGMEYLIRFTKVMCVVVAVVVVIVLVVVVELITVLVVENIEL